MKEVCNLMGKKFEKLTVIEDSGSSDSKGRKIWKCKCDCGNYSLIREDSLKTGNTKSCGCIHREISKKTALFMRKEYLEKSLVEGTNLTIISENRKLNKNNTSGVKGVHWNKEKNKWRAVIYFKKKTIHLGDFFDKQDAIDARLEAEEKYFKPILAKYTEQGGRWMK